MGSTIKEKVRADEGRREEFRSQFVFVRKGGKHLCCGVWGSCMGS